MERPIKAPLICFRFLQDYVPLMNAMIMGLGWIPWFVPRGADLLNNLPGVILTLWIGLVFATMVYFHGNVKDLEPKPGSVTPIQKTAAGLMFLVDAIMLGLALYLILR
jgi:hypothetical protein